MRFVMMVPLRRCGSNAIRLRMNLHPDFYSPYPLHLCDMEKVFSQYNLSDDLDYFQMVVDMVGLQRHSLVPWDSVVLDPIQVFETVRHKPRSAYQIYWEMLRQVGKNKNAKVVMDKCQDSVCHFEEMVGLFPDMLFLDVVRDPRAQVSSMNGSIIYDFDTCLNTQRWVESRWWSRKIREKFPQQIMTIRYEDFVLNHEETMRSICKFVGIPFDPVVLDIEKSQEAFMMSHTSPLWETNFSRPVVENIDKYRSHLSLAEIEHIENMTWEWMRQYHYTPISRYRPQMVLCYEPVAASSKEKLTWERLRKEHPYDYVLRKNRARYLRSVKKNL